MVVNLIDSHGTGDSSIDEDHKRLTDLFNKFEAITEGEINFESLERAFIELEKHTIEHFCREEALMLTVGYPELDKHKQSHLSITTRLEEMHKNIHSASSEGMDGEKIIRDMSVVLNNLLDNHLNGLDSLYKTYVVKYRTSKDKSTPDGQSDGRDRRGGADDASSGDRRGGSDVSSRDRRGEGRTSSFPVWRIIVLVLVGIIAGGTYWLYGDTKNSFPPTEAIKSANSVKAPALAGASKTGLEWVAGANCEQLPKVKWWKNSSHMKIARYVRAKHSGNWKPYVKKWSGQLKKLENISSRGAAALAPGGERLEGRVLDDYISAVSKRVDIIKCLADEAAAYAAR